MAISFSAFLVLYNISIVVAVAISTLIFGDISKITKENVKQTIRDNYLMILLLSAIPVFVLCEKRFYVYFPDFPSHDYTPLIASFFGEITADIQNLLLNDVMTSFMIFVYVYGFTFIIYFTPYLILINRDNALMKKYTKLILLNYAVLIPFYFFFPVYTPALSDNLTTVTPILYNNAYFGKMVAGIDPLDNCFPSGHVSLVLSTLLILWKTDGKYRRYRFFLVLSFALIVLAVLYLGIHWVADVLAGIVLALSAYYVIEKGYLEKLSKKLAAFMRPSRDD